MPKAHRREERTRSEAVLAPEESVYGRHPVREVLAGPRHVHVIHASAGAQRDLADELVAANAAGVRVVTATPPELDVLVGSSDHQGVVAEVEAFSYCTIDQLLEAAAAEGEPSLVLCLDQVTDPHNLGAIARVCDASGASGLLLPEHRSAKVTAAVCKASAGAIEHVQVAVCTNIADTLERVKGATLWVYGASERGTGSYTDPDYSDGVIFVFGSEGAGLRPRVASMCDQLVAVPMQGNVSSLNVSTVASLFAYEVVRQRGTAQ